jgi:hypothetical protein
MPSRAFASVSLALLTACQSVAPVRRGPPAAIVTGLRAMMVETGVVIACLGDSSGVPSGTLPVDLLLAPDSSASSSVVRVRYTRTPVRDQAPGLSVAVSEIEETRNVGEGCGSRGVTLRATAARFSALELSFTTWVPIRITVRDPEWQALATQTLTESNSRPLELTWR